VLTLQNKLKDLGFFSGTATGYFGTRTQQSVIDYQTAHSLKADGKAGPDTLSSILGSDFVISPDNRFFPSSEVSADSPQPGDKGAAVSDIQNRLKELDYYVYPSITGYYGPVTEQAVSLFQTTNGLKADGVTGVETLKLLNSDNAKYYCISYGDSSDDVKKLQIRLCKLGYLDETAQTGYFGNVTLDAVKEFQARNGLSVDAKAGKNTRSKLYSDAALSWDNIDRVPDEGTPSETASSASTLIDFANSQLGKPYVYAAEGPDAFDCSGFVCYTLRCSGFSIKRCSSDSLSKNESWTKISQKSTLVPGDILFFQSDLSTRINHTGIYLGDNLFIHASSSNNCVTVSNLSDYYDRNFSFARRLF
jgi:peptidoglycan hydrolase-like protein with peptidoglycan-binding domain